MNQFPHWPTTSADIYPSSGEDLNDQDSELVLVSHLWMPQCSVLKRTVGLKLSDEQFTTLRIAPSFISFLFTSIMPEYLSTTLPTPRAQSTENKCNAPSLAPTTTCEAQ
uniref:Similar to protein kinase family protein / WD-40 repeat family protein n=1 Tax=Arundo donax TaxID=35708 RepID=A0A0A9E345_ARUDO